MGPPPLTFGEGGIATSADTTTKSRQGRHSIARRVSAGSTPPAISPSPVRDGTPDAAVFHQLAAAGKRLADLHVNYESQPEYPLQEIWKPGSKLDYRVEKMRLGRDKTSLIYNESLTLAGIPPACFDYRLGNRSALDWIIDQYQVSTDKRSGITNDPNREDDPQYILKLIKQVIHVSLETTKIVNSLPKLLEKTESANA